MATGFTFTLSFGDDFLTFNKVGNSASVERSKSLEIDKGDGSDDFDLWFGGIESTFLAIVCAMSEDALTANHDALQTAFATAMDHASNEPWLDRGVSST